MLDVLDDLLPKPSAKGPLNKQTGRADELLKDKQQAAICRATRSAFSAFHLVVVTTDKLDRQLFGRLEKSLDRAFASVTRERLRNSIAERIKDLRLLRQRYGQNRSVEKLSDHVI